MPLISNIRTVLSGVAAKFADGVVEYRALTSAPNATPRTYGAWTVIPVARLTEFNESQVQDEQGVWYREESCELRIPLQANVSLTIREQVRNGTAAGVSLTNQVWSVREQRLSAAGSVSAYGLYRRTPLMGNVRQGGV